MAESYSYCIQRAHVVYLFIHPLDTFFSKHRYFSFEPPFKLWHCWITLSLAFGPGVELLRYCPQLHFQPSTGSSAPLFTALNIFCCFFKLVFPINVEIEFCFSFIFQIDFCCVAQDGMKLLIDPSASAYPVQGFRLYTMMSVQMRSFMCVFFHFTYNFKVCTCYELIIICSFCWSRILYFVIQLHHILFIR